MLRLACVLALFVQLLDAQVIFLGSRGYTVSLPMGSDGAPGDVDGDGDLDLVATIGNSLHLFLNDSTGRFTDATAGRLPPPTITAFFSIRAIQLADIDGDGDLDILIAASSLTTNFVYQNNGAGVFTEITATALPANGFLSQDQAVGDFDGDGDVDWMTFDSLTQSHLYRNDGTGTFTDVSASAGLPPRLGALFVHAITADLDGDGDLDVVTAVGPQILVNQGNLTFQLAATTLPPVNTYAMTAEDLDGDGDLDLLFSEPRVLRNDGNLTFVDVTSTAFPSALGFGSAAPIDADGDGHTDLAMFPDFWRNNGNLTFGRMTMGFGPITDWARGDFDGDGDEDYINSRNFSRQVHAWFAPVRGAPYQLDLHVRPGPSPTFAVLAVAAQDGTVPLGNLGTLHLDPNASLVVTARSIAATPSSITWNIPAWPGLLGAELHYQALFIDPVTGPRLSNAFVDVIQ